jgi:hypothetical protein
MRPCAGPKVARKAQNDRDLISLSNRQLVRRIASVDRGRNLKSATHADRGTKCARARSNKNETTPIRADAKCTQIYLPRTLTKNARLGSH